MGADEYLRVTWHDERSVAVFSQWKGAECTAAIPLRVSELGELVALLDDATTESGESASWPAPDPAAMVVPAAGFDVAAAKTA